MFISQDNAKSLNTLRVNWSAVLSGSLMQSSNDGTIEGDGIIERDGPEEGDGTIAEAIKSRGEKKVLKNGFKIKFKFLYSYLKSGSEDIHIKKEFIFAINIITLLFLDFIIMMCILIFLHFLNLFVAFLDMDKNGEVQLLLRLSISTYVLIYLLISLISIMKLRRRTPLQADGVSKAPPHESGTR